MKRLIIAVLMILSISVAGFGRVRVVTTTSDLKALVEYIGGNNVQVTALARPLQDPHYLDATPGMVVRISRAQLLVENGLELEMGWLPEVLRETRNRDVRPGGRGYVDASQGVAAIQIPERISRDQGDVHPSGNPHYTLEPVRAIPAARNIRDGLIRVDSANKTVYEQNFARYEEESRALLAQWREKFAPFKGAGVIVYHKHFDYLLKALGLEVVDAIEPLPGLAPTARHVANLLSRYTPQTVRFVIVEPWHDMSVSRRVAEGIGVPLVEGVPAVGAVRGTDTIFSMFEENAQRILAALQR